MRYTLHSDGSSDAVLLHILSWLLAQHTRECFEPQWADLRGLRQRPRLLADRIRAALEWYPCDLLFVHRDAEKEPPENRVEEIHGALSGIEHPPAVCVIPVRMQEAWLLFDEPALRQAADCPRGTMALDMPRLDRIERDPDPKNTLHGLLRTASGLGGRRAKQFRPGVKAHRLAELIEDFSPLRRLSAFQKLEKDVREVLPKLGCLLLA